MQATTKIATKEEVTNTELTQLFEKFWQVEETNHAEEEVAPPLNGDLEKDFQKNTRIDTNGKYVVKISFISELNTLGESHTHAYKRLMSLERRLNNNKDLRDEYNKFMQEYIDLGHMVLVNKEDERNVAYYIPHSCVVKPDSSTTKLRVVFDASAKTSNGRSLNDLQAVGPVIQRDQFDLAIEFRGHDVVMTADVAKMYRQVLIDEPQTWAQCILYRFNESK